MIVTSTFGDLYCKETQQKFGPKYYTFITKRSRLIDDLLGRGTEKTAGLRVLQPSKDVDASLLKDLVEGETFPGSSVKTQDVIETMEETQLALWTILFPDLNWRKKKKAIKKIVKTEESVPTEPEPKDDVFRDLE